ncbi:hypothetical protein HWC07_gp066 [Pantoea phage vB_PagM_LIET2]|uniref:Lipoprotein n=1 Tax=Pantoea phage vB_PagM_LIET2 TaxID=2508071 RepID=A0A411AW55_9CAUD|nr:hypothetical protein HWC07_gp066 [Pantoea phage vB_PagM_LIET2]QAX92318.1 hypothetical protein LIET2_gp066 [Pantoea phage vB_PagM_LIET2]UJH95965.1 putative o-spanin [Pantoea phage Nafs113]
MKKIILAALVAAAALSVGCTDTTMAGYSAYGKPHEITVYQMDKIIYHGFSTGKVKQSEHQIQFEDKETREFVDISLGMSASVITKVLP